jgi:hypothetical protein
LLTLLIQDATLGTSVLVILAAYVLGHAVYPLSYGLPELSVDCNLGKDNSFNEKFQNTLCAHPDFCLSLLVRYRALARFSRAMVLPIALIACIAAYRIGFLPQAAGWAAFIWLVLMLCAVGFWCRYTRYWRRAEIITEWCEHCPLFPKNRCSARRPAAKGQAGRP